MMPWATRTIKKTLAWAAVFAAAVVVPAEIAFEHPNINAQDEILFTVRHDVPGSPAYRTVFMGNAAKTGDAGIITCFPEKMDVLSGGAVLQLRNRYGTARYAVADGTLAWVARGDSVPAESIRLGPQSVSPDGRWLCYVRKTGVATGELILKNASTFAETVLDDHADFSFDSVPVRWSPDSATVVYEKDGAIYFTDLKAAFQQVQMTEAFRKIGTGKISSVCWANGRTLMYINHDVVYRVNTTELYTRGMYAPLVGSGVVTGRLPVAFNPLEDRFYVNEKADRLLVVQGNHVLSAYTVQAQGFSYLPAYYSKPFVDERGSIVACTVFWTQDDAALVWADIISNDDGVRRGAVYRLADGLRLLSVIDRPGKPVLSPDGMSLAFAVGESLYVYDIAAWKATARLNGERQVSYVWHGNDTLFVGGVSTVRAWHLGEKSAELLFLSAAKTAFWTDDALVCAEDAVRDDVRYQYDRKKNRWRQLPAGGAAIPARYAVQNGRYRVFVGSTANQRYADTLYVRTLSGGAENKAFFPDTAVKTARRKRVALVCDATDSADGLTRILSVLGEYGVNATFFVNGEFVRRYPAEAKRIALSGYDCASMFFTAADLTAKGFVVDDDFIRRGLARNEDEFFAATGKELSLIWHAPYYRATAAMKAAGFASGYRYADCGALSMDTQTFERAVACQESYLTASEIIASCVQRAQDGTVIPVVTGITDGTRSDFLYDKLDLLITALWDAGFDIVPLRQFI